MAGRDPSIVIVTHCQMSGFDLELDVTLAAAAAADNEEVAAQADNGGGEGYHDPHAAAI